MNSSSASGGQRAARIIIVDDHVLVREGLRAVLSSEENIEVVGEAQDGQEALKMCKELRPDLVLMDVRMPKMDGLEATRRLKEQSTSTSVLMVTMHDNPDYLFEAIKAGAAGYVLKDATGERLVSAVRRTLGGESALNQELALQLLSRLASEKKQNTEPPLLRARPEPPLEKLTPRELDVLRFIALGQTNPEIARNIHVSRGTVKSHVQRIIAKLGVSDRTQAAVRAIELGLIEPQTSG